MEHYLKKHSSGAFYKMYIVKQKKKDFVLIKSIKAKAQLSFQLPCQDS